MKKTLVIVVCAIFAITMALAGCSSTDTASTADTSSSSESSASTEASASADDTTASESSASAETSAAASDDASSSDDTATKDASDIKVLVMPKLLGIPYFNASETGAKKCAEDYGFEVIYDAPTESDATQQVNMLQDYIARGDIDAIAIAPNDPDGIAPILKQATDAGIKVIDWDTAAPPDSVLYSVHQIDDQEYGESVWGAVLEGMGDATDYAILTGGLEAANLNTWIDYGEAYKEQNYPDKNLVQEKIATNESQQEAYSKTLDLLKAYPDVKGIICMSTPTVPGAGQAIQELGLSGEITAIGSGMPKDSAPYLKDKSVTASYLWDVENLGYLAAYVAYICASGQDLQDNLTIDAFDAPIQIKEDGKTVIMGAPLIITDQNVDQFDY